MDRILIAGGTEVLVGDGALHQGILPARRGRLRTAVLTQPGAAHWGRAVARVLRAEGLDAPVRVLPDGEAAKTLDVAADVYEWLIEVGLGRDDTLVGVGGGALTDVAGFVAATFLRGIEAVHVPTTLLGAVDAAVGGKTGVNVGGKNLVGAFWPPSRVLVDLAILEDLPEDLRRAGLAEALKAGLVGDPELVALLEEHRERAPLAEVVARAVTVKAGVVGEDPREAGRRAILNYGHTVGHAVEVAAGMPHGEAVAVGMVAAGAASELVLGFPDAERVAGAIAGLGLPTATSGLDPGRVRDLLALDKKRREGGLRMVLLRSVGEAEVRPVDEATVRAALAAIGVA